MSVNWVIIGSGIGLVPVLRHMSLISNAITIEPFGTNSVKFKSKYSNIPGTYTWKRRMQFICTSKLVNTWSLFGTNCHDRLRPRLKKTWHVEHCTKWHTFLTWLVFMVVASMLCVVSCYIGRVVMRQGQIVSEYRLITSSWTVSNQNILVSPLSLLLNTCNINSAQNKCARQPLLTTHDPHFVS